MAQVDIFHDADVTVNVVVGNPPIDQTAQIAALTAQVAQLTTDLAAATALADARLVMINNALAALGA